MRLLVAQTALLEQLSLPLKQRNLATVSLALDEAETPEYRSALANPWRLDVLAASFFLLSRPESVTGADRDQLLERLRRAENGPQSTPQLWQRLTFLYEQLKAPEDADRVLGKFVATSKEAKASAQAILAQAGLASLRGNGTEARRVLEEGLSDTSLSAEDRQQIELGLVNLDRAAGDLQAALARLAKVADANRPAPASVVAQIVELRSTRDKPRPPKAGKPSFAISKAKAHFSRTTIRRGDWHKTHAAAATRPWPRPNSCRRSWPRPAPTGRRFKSSRA